MMFRRVFCALSPLTLAVTFAAVAPAQTSHPLIAGPIDDAQRVTLAGNVRPEANAANDRGEVADDFSLAHMQLQLKRSPDSEAALEQYIAELSDPHSPNYHKWLTPQQFAASYGVAPRRRRSRNRMA